MTLHRPSGILAALTGGLRVPTLSKAGAVVIAIGLHADLVEHAFVFPTQAAGQFPPGEHLTHLVVLLGMVLLLAGVVADGARAGRGRTNRPEGSSPDAVR
jgi:hypothetical protein